MIVDFVIIFVKFIVLLFVVNFVVGTLFTLIELTFFKRTELDKSNLYLILGFVFMFLNIVANVLIYRYLTHAFLVLFSESVLSRLQVLLMFVPLLSGISLLNSIANQSMRSFTPNIEQGKSINMVVGFINISVITLFAVQIISLIYPNSIELLFKYFNFSL